MQYRVNLSTWASTSVLVEADDKAEAVRKAEDGEILNEFPSLCHQCTGHGGARGSNLDIGDEWTATDGEESVSEDDGS